MIQSSSIIRIGQPGAMAWELPADGRRKSGCLVRRRVPIHAPVLNDIACLGWWPFGHHGKDAPPTSADSFIPGRRLSRMTQLLPKHMHDPARRMLRQAWEPHDVGKADLPIRILPGD